jgi:hypothetical protein
MAAPLAASLNVTSETIVFSSTTVPHDTQKPFPAAVSYSMTVPPHAKHIACKQDEFDGYVAFQVQLDGP